MEYEGEKAEEKKVERGSKDLYLTLSLSYYLKYNPTVMGSTSESVGVRESSLNRKVRVVVGKISQMQIPLQKSLLSVSPYRLLDLKYIIKLYN